MLGYTHEEMLRLTFHDIPLADDLEGVVDQINRILAGEMDTYTKEIKYRRKDGQIIWALVTISLVYDKAGQSRWFVAVINDISERKRSQKELKRIRNYTDHLIQTANVMIVGLDADGLVTHFNPAAEAITGYSLSEIKEKNWFETLVPRDRYPEVYEEFNRLMKGGLPRYFENPIMTKDGRERVISWTNSEINLDEEILGVTSFGIDVTERKMAEAALRESEEKYRSLVEQSPFSIQILNTDGYIDQINEAFKKLWGIPDEELPEVLEKYNILEDEEAEKLGVSQAVQRAFHGENVILPVIEYDAVSTMENLGLSGTEANKRWIQSRLYPVKNRKGEVVKIIDIEEDVTDRMKAEKNVQRYQERLKALASKLTIAEEKERRRIAADLHDHVQQSLAAARLQLAAARKFSSKDKLAAALDDISENLREALQDTRQLVFDLSLPSMNEIGLAAAVSEWLKEHVEKKHGLETELVDECGESPVADDVRAMLFRSVRELIANVVKHAQATRISVHIKDAGGYMEISVRDNGIGFDPEAVSDMIGHTGGFGLFSIKERMSDLGGAFDIFSKPGKGCEAVLTAPLAKR
jgi:PAS domain S-box-containing protein